MIRDGVESVPGKYGLAHDEAADVQFGVVVIGPGATYGHGHNVPGCPSANTLVPPKDAQIFVHVTLKA